MRLALVLTMLVMAEGAAANRPDDESVLRALWSDPGAASGLFSDIALRHMPIARIAEVVDALKARCGAVEAVRKAPQPGRFALQTVHCEIPTLLRRDDRGEIVGLWFSSPARRGVSLDEALGAIERFDGSVSYAVVENSRVIAGHAEDERLAVGSAFKLIVLAALLEHIGAGAADWSDERTLSAGHISLPTGRLAEMPPGSRFTLRHLAARMIAESDNTAADMVIAFVGRRRLEALSGLSPFLTTREFFLLKSDEALYRRYAEASRDERRTLLAALAESPLPEVNAVLRPLQAHAEWYLSTRRLCAWMDKVAHLDITQINPGPVDGSRWTGIAYKGGSEIGVLNLTTRARDEQGRQVCVSATWNAPRPIDEAALLERYATLFQALAERP